jgi:hypothetical protein
VPKKKKIFFWSVTGVSALLILLITLALLSTLIVNQKEILEKIQAEVSRSIKGDVEFQSIGLSFFFRPHAVIHQSKFAISGKATGTIESLAVYPALLPLLTGRVRISKLKVEAPNIQIKLPERIDTKNKRSPLAAIKDIQQKIVSALGPVTLPEPGLVILLKAGRLKLFEGNTSAFWFKDLQAYIEMLPKKLMLNVSCKSSIAERISLYGWLDPSNFKSSVQVNLTQFQPQLLADYLIPRTLWRLAEGHTNLSLNFKTDGPHQLITEIQAKIPYLNLSQGKNKLVIKAARIKGDIQVDNNRVAVSLKEMNLEYPKLNVAGNLILARNEPRASLHLEGRQLDVESVRHVALKLAGGIPTVQKIFKRVKGGRVPLITFKTQGKSISDFKDKKNIFIQGSMVDGKISIPKAGLDLEGVNGDAVISQGILEGENLVARYGNSRGRDGTLRVGLKRKPAPLHLDIGVTADVAQIPPVLKRLVKNQPFQKELEQIKNLKGNATGRLWLGESTAAIKVRVDVSEFELEGNYGRIPFPLAIKGGRFSYKSKQVDVENLRGKLGQTSFAQLSAGLNWETEPTMAVTSGKYEVLLEEIFPWLVSVEGLPFDPDDIRTVDGVLALSTLSIKGPLLRPENWELASTGEIRNLTLNTTLLPGPVEVTAAKFTENQNSGGQKFSFSNAQISMLDSSFKARGNLQDYFKGLKDADITFEGDMGPEVTQWLSHLIRLPPEIYPRPPLLISQARLLWQKGNKTSFTGDLVVKNGTRVSIDATRNPEELIISKLLIRDEASHASIQLDFKNRECGLDFIGHLSKTTIDNLLAKTPVSGGWIRGDFHTQIVLDHPMQSTSHGKLDGQGIVLKLKSGAPLKIDSLSLDAAGNNIKVASAVVTWEDIHMILGGDVNFFEEEFLFDLDLSSSGMDWVKIKKIFEKKDTEKNGKDNNKLFDIPLRGTVRLKSESFRFKKFTWSPLQADISFDPDEININVKKANLCGISTPGVLKISSQDIRLDFKPGSHYQSLDPALTCLLNRSHQIDGKFKLAGNITGQGKAEELIQSLHGKLRFDARDGRIYRSLILARILAFINVTEIFNGSLTDLEKEGFGYKKIKIKTKIKKGRLRFKEISMDGNTLTLTGKGTLDLNNNALDLTLLVAPLKTVDRLVDKVPLVGDIIGDIISIPFRVKGDVRDPKVVPLSPSAIGADLIGIMQKTLKLPFKIFQPIFPNNKKNKEED